MRSSKKNNVVVEWKGTLPNTNIAVDSFLVKNAVAYFLSHAHSDHHVGLSGKFFQKDDKRKIYCTELTKTLISAKCPQLSGYFEVLNMNEERVLFFDGVPIHVTPLNANHCPGSVMFLFESNHGTTLYTGDFRFEREDLSENSFSFLKDKKIDKIFLDSTFCDPMFEHLPTRRQSIDAVINFLQKDNSQIVYLAFDMLGTEPLLIAIAQHFNVKLYVDKKAFPANRFREMMSLTFLKKHLTSKPTKFRLVGHKVLFDMADNPYKNKEGGLLVRGTTMWTRQEYEQACLHYKKPKVMPNGVHQFIFSMHSSFSELRHFVKIVNKNKAQVTPLSHAIASVGKGVDVLRYFCDISEPVLNQKTRRNYVYKIEDEFDFSYTNHSDILLTQITSSIEENLTPPTHYDLTNDDVFDEQHLKRLFEDSPPSKRLREDDVKAEQKSKKIKSLFDLLE
ncbi:5' exonuclease Apollo [Acrasis kona]|uniref:5' exonuclease Apollo n=1 Tax=Acrasis kona TaxID=1008807 RepID=A0AAW2YZE2_9EUKA